MNTYCTIITRSHIPFARVLFDSLAGSEPGVNLQVLVVDDAPGQALPDTTGGPQFQHLHTVMDTIHAKDIFNKYAHTNPDHFRWALKPVFMLYLLDQFEKVIYIDADIYFTGAHGFLFKELDTAALLLAPHGSNIEPLEDEDGLFSVLRNGLYSGGFVGASKSAAPTLRWWAGACHYKMEKVKELGLYDDQKYLDLFPVINESCSLLRHPGCNLSNINIRTATRSRVNERVLINEKFDPVFIHFTKDTIHNIHVGNDPLLLPYLEAYLSALKKAGASESVAEGNYPGITNSIRQKLLLRTRIKRLFFKLAEKL